MDHVHDEVLRKNCKFLKDNLKMEGLLDLMLEKGVFSPKMADEIRSKETTCDQTNTFFIILRRRGPKAFDVFMEGLRKSSQTLVLERMEHSLGLDHVDQIH